MQSVMRSVVALVTLACGGWAQSAVMDCALLAPPGVDADIVTDSGHGPHARMHPPADEALAAPDGAEDHSTGHSSASCLLLIGCGSTALTARSTAGPAIASPTPARATPGQPDHVTAIFPTHEPPPPRL